VRGRPKRIYEAYECYCGSSIGKIPVRTEYESAEAGFTTVKCANCGRQYLRGFEVIEEGRNAFQTDKIVDYRAW